MAQILFLGRRVLALHKALILSLTTSRRVGVERDRCDGIGPVLIRPNLASGPNQEKGNYAAIAAVLAVMPGLTSGKDSSSAPLRRLAVAW